MNLMRSTEFTNPTKAQEQKSTINYIRKKETTIVRFISSLLFNITSKN